MSDFTDEDLDLMEELQPPSWEEAAERARSVFNKAGVTVEEFALAFQPCEY